MLLVDHSCAATLNQTSARTICFMTFGLIQAAFLWATGRDADVEQIACKAADAPVSEFQITLASK